MPRRTPTPESEQSIPEMVNERTRQEIATWYKDGKLPASQQEEARQGWTKILHPFKCREPWL